MLGAVEGQCFGEWSQCLVEAELGMINKFDCWFAIFERT
jgi:hypothetical protein